MVAPVKSSLSPSRKPKPIEASPMPHWPNRRRPTTKYHNPRPYNALARRRSGVFAALAVVTWLLGLVCVIAATCFLASDRMAAGAFAGLSGFLLLLLGVALFLFDGHFRENPIREAVGCVAELGHVFSSLVRARAHPMPPMVDTPQSNLGGSDAAKKKSR